MKRATLRPIRTRRLASGPAGPSPAFDEKFPGMTTKTRKTLAAVGVLWITFATSAYAASPIEVNPAATSAG